MQSIYALTDPDDEQVHYIGRAQDVHKRYGGHLIAAHEGGEKNTWIATMKSTGKLPGLLLLEVDIDDTIAPERERYWIYHYLERGAPLINVAMCAQARRETRQQGLSLEQTVDPTKGKLISAGEVAEIWNERAKAMGYANTHYTRFSVRQRHRKAKPGNELVPVMETPLGYLYWEQDAWTVPLQPRKSRTDRKPKQQQSTSDEMKQAA